MENGLGWNSPKLPIPFTASCHQLVDMNLLHGHWTFLVSLGPLTPLLPLLPPSCFPPCVVFTLSPQHQHQYRGYRGSMGYSSLSGTQH